MNLRQYYAQPDTIWCARLDSLCWRVVDDLNAWLVRTDREGTAHQQLAAAFLAKQERMI